MNRIQRKIKAQRMNYSTVSISGIASIFLAAKFTMMLANLPSETKIKQNENRQESK